MTRTDLLYSKYPDVRKIEPIGAGAWSTAYSFTAEGSNYVIRWGNDRESFDRDALAHSLFNNDKLPLPKVFEVGAWESEYYAISELRDGIFIESLIGPQLTSTLPAIYSLFDALRTADLSKTSGYGLWDERGVGRSTSWREFLEGVSQDNSTKLTHGWRTKIELLPNLKTKFDELYADFRPTVEKCPETRYLIHSDLINRNVLVKSDTINAVLDWGSSMFGDYLYDVAWILYYEPWYPSFGKIELSRLLIEHVQKLGGELDKMKERIACYLYHIGLDSVGYNVYKGNEVEAERVIIYTRRLVRDWLGK